MNTKHKRKEVRLRGGWRGHRGGGRTRASVHRRGHRAGGVHAQYDQ